MLDEVLVFKMTQIKNSFSLSTVMFNKRTNKIKLSILDVEIVEKKTH